MKNRKSVELTPKEPLYDQVLFLDGVGRAGKFLLGKICSNFERVETFQYVESLEHIPILSSLNLIEKTASISMMHIILDSSIYNLAIGRGLNLRKEDSSSVTHSTEYKEYLARTENKDGMEAISRLKQLNRLPSFLVHECLPHINFFIEAFPYLQMIHIQRHPIDLSHSWMLKGWGRRFGVDPLAFIPTIDSNDVPAPWYSEEWKEKYSGLSEVDRVIRSVCTLQKISSQSYDLLKESQKNQVLIINYEEFFSNPSLIIKKLSNFLNTHPFSNMEEVFKREGCPKEIPLSSRMSKFKELSRQASPKIIRELKEVSEEYEFQWDLEPST